MKKLGLILLVASCFSLPARSWIFPNASKAQTEKEQLEEMEKQTALMEQQTKVMSSQAGELTRIADSLEKLATRQ